MEHLISNNPQDISTVLARLPLFHTLDAQQIQRIAQFCSIRQFQRGDDIARHGEACREFHLVLSGQVKLYAISPAGQEKIIQLLGTGHTFGEALMFMEKPYVVSVQALAETRLLTVKRQGIVNEIQNSPDLAFRMLAGMSARLHKLVVDLEAHSLHSGLQRVIGYLLHATDKENKVSLPVSKATIASLLNLTPEYFSRVLRELEDQNLIRVDKRDIYIVDINQLSHYQNMA